MSSVAEIKTAADGLVVSNPGILGGTLSIGNAGGIDAARFAAAVLGAKHPELREALGRYRAARTQTVLESHDPRS